MVDVLARQGCDVNQVSKGRMTPVMLAASLGFSDIIQVLLLAACELECCDVSGRRALHLATEAGHIATVRLLLQSGADPSVGDKKKVTPLLCEYDFSNLHMSNNCYFIWHIDLQNLCLLFYTQKLSVLCQVANSCIFVNISQHFILNSQVQYLSSTMQSWT